MSLSTRARWPCLPPHFVVFTAAVILATCCLRQLTDMLDGCPTILSIVVGAMMARMTSQTVTLLAVKDDIVDWLFVLVWLSVWKILTTVEHSKYVDIDNQVVNILWQSSKC